MNPTSPRRSRALFLAVLCSAGGSFLSSCGDDLGTNSLTPGRARFAEEAIQLPGVEATACQYGGEYPHCFPKPQDQGGATTSPFSEPDPNSPAGSGGGGGSGTGDGANTPPASPGDDAPQDTAIPDCATVATTQHTADDAWCGGRVPQDTALTRIQQSLGRLRARGAACQALADRASEMLAAGTFRITDVHDPNWAAATPLGGDWTVMNSDWVTTNWSEANLDFVISHEMDHALNHVLAGVTDNRGHLLKPDGTVDPYHTPNSHACSGT